MLLEKTVSLELKEWQSETAHAAETQSQKKERKKQPCQVPNPVSECQLIGEETSLLKFSPLIFVLPLNHMYTVRQRKPKVIFHDLWKHLAFAITSLKLNHLFETFIHFLFQEICRGEKMTQSNQTLFLVIDAQHLLETRCCCYLNMNVTCCPTLMTMMTTMMMEEWMSSIPLFLAALSSWGGRWSLFQLCRATAVSTPEWVSGSSRALGDPFGGSTTCSRVPRRPSEGDLAPPLHLRSFVNTGIWTRNPLILHVFVIKVIIVFFKGGLVFSCFSRPFNRFLLG